jgi:uncharacterized protein YecE (DUF72 family)
MIRIGTCSWKYDSWQSLVYTTSNRNDYLQEYGKQFDTVEIDQWFWSLFPPDKTVLPQQAVVSTYTQAVSDDFKFTVKIPNSITLTHFYRKHKQETLVPNPHFLSLDLMERFIDKLQPMASKIGILLFQFEYLNRQKMASLVHFIDCIRPFLAALDRTFSYGLEIRNPNYLNYAYFAFLREIGISHVFLQGYYMPDISQIYYHFKDLLNNPVVLRLHGPGRSEIEEQSGGNWDKILQPKDDELAKITQIIQDLDSRHLDVYINVNNHYEGSAPLTIEKLRNLL